MDAPLSEKQWKRLLAEGYLRLPGAARHALPDLEAAVSSLMGQFPYGFADPKYYTGNKPQPLTAENARASGRILIPYAGFLDNRIIAPLADPYLHELLERIVGKDFYLSNTWYQEVPPATPRLAYHKDTRGSISFNILLDEIETGMGSTCLIPGSHINTPPARYCFADLHVRQSREVDVTGSRGDIVLFSTEAWHGRSRNDGTYRTRRLFYNFYSRSSRDTTTWAGIVQPSQIEAARSVLPRTCWHMFELDPPRTRRLAAVNGGSLKRWAYAKSSSDTFWRDFAYAFCAYGRLPTRPEFPGYLMPYTTALTAARPFDIGEYLAHLRIIPTLKNIYVFLRKKVLILWPEKAAQYAKRAALPGNS